jgi:hypothetical protein
MKMPKEKMDINMFAPCGMNCKVCYKHCYHKKPCAGCLNSDKGKPEHCSKCNIKDCIKEKSLSYCLGHFTRNYTQTVKRAADNKQALCSRQGA